MRLRAQGSGLKATYTVARCVCDGEQAGEGGDGEQADEGGDGEQAGDGGRWRAGR